MKFFLNRILLNLFVLALFSGSTEAAVNVYAQVDTSEDIYAGETFGYYIIIDGDNKAGEVDLAPLAKYSPREAGNRDVSQTSISIINGKTTKNVTKRFVMSYSLVFGDAGPIEIPPVPVTIDGETYRTNPINVNILKPGTTDQLDLEVALSEDECYVGQPVLMTVKFYVSADIGNFRFTIPAFNSNDFYIEDPDAFNPQAKQYDLGNGIIVRVSQNRTVHKGKDAILLSFDKILIPRNAGEIVILPASVSADVAVGRVRSRDSFFDTFLGSNIEYKRFMVNSESWKLTVKPLPTEGRPADFYGLVGRYTIQAQAAPAQVNVGDPITLTIRVGGSNYLKPVQWPDLEAVPGMAEDFKIPSERADAELKDSQKVFTQTIRAANENVKEIPPIPLSFFDVEKKQYTTIRTKPIPLDVLPTRIVTGADVESRSFSSASRQIEAVREGISANITGPEALDSQPVTLPAAAANPLILALWFGPLSAWLLSVLYKFSVRTSPQRQAAKRRRSAAGRAIHQIRAVEEKAHPGPDLCAVLKQYVADKLDKSAGALTAGDCADLLCSGGVDSDNAEAFRRMVETLEAAEYSPAPYAFTKDEKEKIIHLVREIEKQIK